MHVRIHQRYKSALLVYHGREEAAVTVCSMHIHTHAFAMSSSREQQLYTVLVCTVLGSKPSAKHTYLVPALLPDFSPRERSLASDANFLWQMFLCNSTGHDMRQVSIPAPRICHIAAIFMVCECSLFFLSKTTGSAATVQYNSSNQSEQNSSMSVLQAAP